MGPSSPAGEDASVPPGEEPGGFAELDLLRLRVAEGLFESGPVRLEGRFLLLLLLFALFHLCSGRMLLNL